MPRSFSTPDDKSVTKNEGNRGFLGWRSSLDYLMRNSTDFDGMGRE